MSLTIDFLIFLAILFVHYVADFVMQTDEQAKNKATSTKALFNHVLVYSATWTIFVFLTMFSPIVSLIFGLVTFASHYTTDYFTSKLVKKYFDKEDHHTGFLVIGMDQILHYIQLFITTIGCFILDAI